jgi:hypothetical protein
MIGHAWGLTTFTASGRPLLRNVTPVRFPSRASIAHTTCRDGTGCHDRQTAPACGASGKWGHNVEIFPSSTSIRATGPTQGGKDDVTSKALFLLVLSLSCNCNFPLTYKRGGRIPHKGGRKELDPTESDLTPFDSSIRDLGPSPSLACL